MKSAMIHFEPVFQKWEQRLFKKKAFKKVKSAIVINGKEIPLYRIPVTEKNPSEKMMLAFVSYLKQENIEKIILSDAAASLSICSILKNHFKYFTGITVINYKLYDILRKCAENRCLELSDSTLVIITNKPEEAKKFILKIYKYVKRIKIKTEIPSSFSELTSFFLYEYGLFIEIVKDIKEQDREIYISFNNSDTPADIYIGNENHTEILFSTKKLFTEIKPYVNMNQTTLEFLIHQLYGDISEKNIKTFFKAYSVRVIKLIK